MLTHRSFRALVPLGLGFVLLIASAVAAIWLSARQEAAVGWVSHTLEVENRINLIGSLITDAESGQRGYLLTGQSIYLAPYQAAVARIPAELDALREGTADNPRERQNLDDLRPAVQQKLSELGGSIALAHLGRGRDAVAVARTDTGRRYMVEVRAVLARMVSEENRLLADRVKSLRWFTIAARAALFVSAALVLILAYFAVRDASRRLAALERANQKLTKEIEDRHSAESQVRQLQKMEAVGQLTGGIAHDFNNMLAIVIGSLDIARRRLTGSEHPKIAQCLDNASEGAERAATLTARLLAFSRQQPLEPKVLDTNKLVGGMSEMLRRTLGERVQVETVLAGGLWRICADAAQIESALVNLAVNARDAMPDGGKLTIETGNCELDERYAAAHDEVTAGQYVMLSVTDTGTGMPDSVIERAFEPFYTTKGVGRGTGLGLSQVFGFIKQSRGHIKIYSEIGRGTTIKLYLPRHIGEETLALTAAERSELPRGQSDEIILVVEDEAQVRHMTVDALRELGYTVVQAGDGNQALEQLALQPRIDLLFTDIVMPGMTGRELADRASRERPNLKILYTTGYTRNAIVHNGIVDYGVAFVAKPFSIEALAKKVRDVLDG
ncbi:CHASE3 domain-containing protein [Sphingomonas oryzagri]|uniref:histidine kinase n=1 Tax=Sphingomonas oryzagri TaxID=3042314 RepID=A0ABT6MYY5_9SPHN|nr:CHASE3 domain-containing protein [Sphingomonas oryzagri]MDH7638172.1 CHASE3 domain-containing protein [Sphingomonas oryzagri]